MKIDTVVFDIDGVLSFCDKRHFCLEGEKDWAMFYSLVEGDEINEPMVRLLNMLFWEMSYAVVLLTSRPASNRLLTENWLHNNDVEYNDLIMRPDGNYDIMWKVKAIKEMRIERHIMWVFEDSPKEIALFREEKWPIIPIQGVDYGRDVFEIGGE